MNKKIAEKMKRKNTHNEQTVAITINLTIQYTTYTGGIVIGNVTKRNAQLATLVKGLTFSHWGRAHGVHIFYT